MCSLSALLDNVPSFIPLPRESRCFMAPKRIYLDFVIGYPNSLTALFQPLLQGTGHSDLEDAFLPVRGSQVGGQELQQHH
jgi:hypothetical protein